MASKRMFSRQITESDDFLELPLQAQCLYFHLSLSADDEGFIISARMIMRVHEIDKSKLDELIEKGFVISFDKSLCIRHWTMNNQLRFDRFNKSECKDRDKIRISPTGKLYYTVEEIEQQSDLITVTLDEFIEQRKQGKSNSTARDEKTAALRDAFNRQYC